jgi:hypothetical protein
VVCFCVGVTTAGVDGSLEVGVEVGVVGVVVEGAVLDDGADAGVAIVFEETDGCDFGLPRNEDGVAITRSDGTTGIDAWGAGML